MSARLDLATVGRAGWGALLVTVPDAVFASVSGRSATRGERLVLRILGARHLAQAAVVAVRPTPVVLGLGVAVDLLHAATCAGALAFLPGWRRSGAVDGAVAVGFAISGRSLLMNSTYVGE